MTVDREVVESPLNQGKDEAISYQLNTLPWGGTPTNVAVTIYDVTNGGYVALTGAQMTVVMPTNSPTVNVHVITLSPLKDLTPRTVYRVEVKFTSGGDVWEAFFIVIGEN